MVAPIWIIFYKLIDLPFNTPNQLTRGTPEVVSRLRLVCNPINLLLNLLSFFSDRLPSPCYVRSDIQVALNAFLDPNANPTNNNSHKER